MTPHVASPMGAPGAEVELPHVLEAGQRRAVVDPLLERHRLVGAERLAREHLAPRAGDDHAGAVDGELLEAAVRHLVGAAHALPGRRGRRPGAGGRRRRLVDVHLVGAGLARSIAQPLHRPAAEDVRGEDLVQVGRLHPGVPDVVGIDHDHRAVPALGEAAGLVDADLDLLARLLGARPQGLHVPLHVALLRAGLSARAHEDVTLVLAHGRSSLGGNAVS